MVEIARQLPTAERVEHVYVVGLVVMCSSAYGQVPDDLPADITAAYRHALPEALKLLTGTMWSGRDRNRRPSAFQL